MCSGRRREKKIPDFGFLCITDKFTTNDGYDDDADDDDLNVDDERWQWQYE